MESQIRVAQSVWQAFSEIVLSAETCLSSKMHVPALILLYSGIDIAAGLASGDTEINTRAGKRFVKWVGRYIAPETSLSCTANDLYGARCGVVHGFSPQSGLSRGKKARLVYYAHGQSDPAKLVSLGRRLGMPEYIVIHIGDLVKAARDGFTRFLQEAEADGKLATRINQRAISFFTGMTDAEINGLIEIEKKSRRI